MGFTLYPRNNEINPFCTQWAVYCTALENGPGLIVGMDGCVQLGMFFYDEAPRNKNKAFAGCDNFYVLADDARKMGQLLKKKIHIHELRVKELEDMDPVSRKYAYENYKSRLPIRADILEEWRELADFLINSRGYWVR